jgi:AraC family transcriptional regulator
MPISMSRAAQLGAGDFYSGIAAKADWPKAFVCSELVQRTPRAYPTHHHERDYFCLLLGGDYREGTSGRMNEFAPVSAGFNPKHVPHSGDAGRAGAHLFTIEFADDFLRKHLSTVPGETVLDFGTREIVWTALRLFRCFKQRETADTLSFESIACELVGTAQAREDYKNDAAPIWVQRVRDRLDAGIARSCSVSELAHEAGVHPVHLARVFRKVTGVSPGEYLQRARADRACDLLLNSEMPLSDVAAECGFYDQSHMTRILRRYSQTTPGTLRALTALVHKTTSRA